MGPMQTEAYNEQMREGADGTEWDEPLGLQAALGRMTAQRDALQAGYEMAVERCVLAQGYMHPEQKRAFNEAWVNRRAELRELDRTPLDGRNPNPPECDPRC